MRAMGSAEVMNVSGGVVNVPELAWRGDIAGFALSFGLDAAGIGLAGAGIIGIAFAEAVEHNPGYFHSMPRQ
ncbi:hypothetical protein ACFWZ4_14500 [Frateuria sp. GZRe12]|uniref:hypothetical protein n=1 Tax=Frateuria sp. GZRe12 TaxID=3351533 RepID=UPI003EDB8298